MEIARDLFDHAERYPHHPGFKARGTSEEAAREMYPIAGNLRAAVLDAIRAAGAFGRTPDEVAARLHRSPFAIRPRLSELWKDGRIEKTNGRRRNASGKQAAIWRAI